MTQASLLFPNEVQTFQRNFLWFGFNSIKKAFGFYSFWQVAKLKQHWLSFEPVKLHLTNQVSYYYESLTVKHFHQWYILNPCELKKELFKKPGPHQSSKGQWNLEPKFGHMHYKVQSNNESDIHTPKRVKKRFKAPKGHRN